MRIRLHTGHKRGLNVLLRPASACKFDENEPGSEYGIGNFMLFKGAQLEEAVIETDEDFLKEAERLAQVAEQFGIPYLIGKGEDFDAIKEMVNQRTEEAVGEIRKYRFPKNVREEWL